MAADLDDNRPRYQTSPHQGMRQTCLVAASFAYKVLSSHRRVAGSAPLAPAALHAAHARAARDRSTSGCGCALIGTPTGILLNVRNESAADETDAGWRARVVERSIESSHGHITSYAVACVVSARVRD